MNVQENMPNASGTLVHYFATALAFTILSVWVITTFQSRYNFRSVVTFRQHRDGLYFFPLNLDPYAPAGNDLLQHDLDLMLPLIELNRA